MRRKLRAAAVAAAVMAATGVMSTTAAHAVSGATGSAQTDSPNVGSAQASQNSGSAAYCNGSWNFSPWWGDTAGRSCWNPAYVKGWIADSYRDGKCVQMRFDWYRNGNWAGTKYSPRVCDYSQAKNFELTSPDPHADWVNWQFYRV